MSSAHATDSRRLGRLFSSLRVWMKMEMVMALALFGKLLVRRLVFGRTCDTIGC